MWLTKADEPVRRSVYDYANTGYRRTENRNVLEAFVRRKDRCVEVSGYRHKSAQHCAASLRTTITRFGMEHVRVMVRNGRVYLINESIK